MVKRTGWGIAAVVATGLVVSGVCAWYVSQTEKKLLDAELESKVELLALLIESELSQSVRHLRLVQSVLESDQQSVQFEQTLFKDAFARPGGIFLDVEWVDRSVVRDFASQSDGRNESTLTATTLPQETARRDITQSVWVDENALPFDIYETIAKSISLDAVLATPVAEMSNGTDIRKACALIMPVRRTEAAAPGFLFAIISVDAIVEQALLTLPDSMMTFTVYDSPGQGSGQPIFYNGANENFLETSESVYSNPLFFAGREWLVGGHLSNEFYTISNAPWIVFALGSACAFAVGALLVTVRRRTLTLHAQVYKKTLALEDAEKSLKTLSRTDQLTGCFNREYIDGLVTSEIGRARRAGTTLCLIQFEVDYLREYNLEYGEARGTRCSGSLRRR